MYYYLTFYLSFNVLIAFSFSQLTNYVWPSFPLLYIPFFSIPPCSPSSVLSLIGVTQCYHIISKDILYNSSATLCVPITNEDLNTQDGKFRHNNFAHIKSDTITLRYNWLNINISTMTWLEARWNFESKTLCSANRMSFEKLTFKRSFMMKLYLT